MKKLLTLTVIIALVSMQARADLIITWVVDGDLSGGLPKCATIVNTGATSVNLSDYQFANYNNGGTTPSTTFDLSTIQATLASHGVLTLANESDTYASVFGGPPSATTGALSINGDDTVTIRNSDGTILDVYGVVGTDGTGEPWEYEDGYAKRSTTVTAANDTLDLAGEWTANNGSLDGLDAAGHATALAGFGTYEQIPEPGMLIGLLALIPFFLRRK